MIFKNLKTFENYSSLNIDKRIVLTGSPGTGKSSVIDMLKQMSSIQYNIIEEPARELIEYLQIYDKENLPWNNRENFQKLVEKKNIENYKNNKSGFFDRSIVDELGFRSYYGIEIPTYLIDYCQKYRYDKVFIFPPWLEIFKNDNVRKETFSETVELDKHISKYYKEMKYELIVVPKVSVKERIEFILNHI